MSKREYRRFTAEQKIEILREADQPGVTVERGVSAPRMSPSVLYRWRAVARVARPWRSNAMLSELRARSDAEVRHKAEIDRLRAVVAEITAENLELKKDLKLDDLSRVPAQSKAEVIRIVRQTSSVPGGRRSYAGSPGVPVACITGGYDARTWRIVLARRAGCMRRCPRSVRRSASSR